MSEQGGWVKVKSSTASITVSGKNPPPPPPPPSPNKYLIIGGIAAGTLGLGLLAKKLKEGSR